MSLDTLKPKVAKLIEKAQNAGDEEFIGVKYSNFSGEFYNLPKTADARSLDKILREPSEISGAIKQAENGHALDYKFANENGNANGGYFAQLEEVYLPSKVTGLNSTFQYCTKLKTIHGDLSNITGIGNCFNSCKALEQFPNLPNLVAMGNNAFRDCIGLTEVTLPSTITSIHSGAFTSCTNLLNIYVPWAEGAVANAPWGATNATIHYNAEV